MLPQSPSTLGHPYQRAHTPSALASTGCMSSHHRRSRTTTACIAVSPHSRLRHTHTHLPSPAPHLQVQLPPRAQEDGAQRHGPWPMARSSALQERGSPAAALGTALRSSSPASSMPSKGGRHSCWGERRKGREGRREGKRGWRGDTASKSYEAGAGRLRHSKQGISGPVL